MIADEGIPRHLRQGPVGVTSDENGVAGDSGNQARIAPGIFQDGYPLSETVELMAVIIAGLRSREHGGQFVPVEEIQAELDAL